MGGVGSWLRGRKVAHLLAEAASSGGHRWPPPAARTPPVLQTRARFVSLRASADPRQQTTGNSPLPGRTPSRPAQHAHAACRPWGKVRSTTHLHHTPYNTIHQYAWDIENDFKYAVRCTAPRAAMLIATTHIKACGWFGRAYQHQAFGAASRVRRGMAPAPDPTTEGSVGTFHVENWSLHFRWCDSGVCVRLQTCGLRPYCEYSGTGIYGPSFSVSGSSCALRWLLPAFASTFASCASR